MRIEKKGFMEFLQYNNIEGGIGNKGQGQEEWKRGTYQIPYGYVWKAIWKFANL